MRRYLFLFFIFVIFGPVFASAEVHVCNIGADAVDRNRAIQPWEYTGILPKGTSLLLESKKNGRGIECVLGEDRVVVYGSEYPWIYKCGNKIFHSADMEKLHSLTEKDETLLVQNDRAWAGKTSLYDVNSCGPGTECWARAQQFRVNLNFGAGVQGIWHHGLSDTRINFEQDQTAEGGAGGQGGNGYGGHGGAGGFGGSGGQGGSADAVAVSGSSGVGGGENPSPPPISGGPVNPAPPSGGGGPVNP